MPGREWQANSAEWGLFAAPEATFSRGNRPESRAQPAPLSPRLKLQQ
jgi:hypothetical protein